MKTKLAEIKVSDPNHIFAQVQKIFDGNPNRAPESANPFIRIEAVDESTETYSKTQQTANRIDIGISRQAKDFYGTDEDDVIVIKKKIQEIIGKTNCKGVVDPYTIKGIALSKNCLTNADQTCKIADQILVESVRYGPSTRQESSEWWEGIVRITAFNTAFRS